MLGHYPYVACGCGFTEATALPLASVTTCPNCGAEVEVDLHDDPDEEYERMKEAEYEANDYR